MFQHAGSNGEAAATASAADNVPNDRGGGPVVVVEGVRVRFGALEAVRGVSFILRPGDLLGLIGPNGAGKTTLLRALAGLQPVNEGAVWVLGQRLLPGAAEVLRHVGFTPDTPPFYEQLTVRQFLEFIGRGYGLDRAELRERIDFWLEKVWLAEKAEQKVKGLSRGMRQRLGIARTLLPNPAVILLDEPAGGLDPAGRVQFRQLLCDLRDQGKALVVSSHILSDMADYCTHIGIMGAGRMMQLGSVAEVAAGTTGDGAPAEGAGRCRYTILLARPVAGVAEVLEAIAGVTAVRVERDRVVLDYLSDRDEAAALLAQLVGRGLPVASFSPNTPGLEEAYLRSGIAQVD
jgi:ABC-2 type transport system ATP-binding protein